MREEIAYLKSELGLAAKTDRSVALERAFNLTGQQARALIALADAGGKTLSNLQLEDAMERLNRGENAIASIYIWRLRKALGFGAVENVWGRGYRLTPSGLETVRNALGPDQCSTHR